MLETRRGRTSAPGAPTYSGKNRDEGSYTLSHTYDRFLATSRHYRGNNRKKN